MYEAKDVFWLFKVEETITINSIMDGLSEVSFDNKRPGIAL